MQNFKIDLCICYVIVSPFLTMSSGFKGKIVNLVWWGRPKTTCLRQSTATVEYTKREFAITS